MDDHFDIETTMVTWGTSILGTPHIVLDEL
jgi:hypothetical protein